MCKFRDEYERFVAAGAAVFGISSDAPEVNAQFAKDQRLQYPLLTDAGSILRKTFEVGTRKLSDRILLFIDTSRSMRCQCLQ